MTIYVIVFVLLFIINVTDKALSVNLHDFNSKLRPTYDEIFGQKWDNEKIEENKNNQNPNHRQIDQNELNLADSIGNDQTDQFNDQQKRQFVYKFHAIKERIKKREKKHSRKVWLKIEQKISEKLGIYRTKIYKWKKEFGLIRKIKINKKNYYAKKKKEFIVRLEEFKRMPKNGKEKQFAKELGIGKDTLRKWKKELGIEIGKRGYSNEEKARKMNIYYDLKKANPSLSHNKIAEFLKINRNTLSVWTKSKKNR